MAEIPCRRCDSPDCKGCNIYILATALQQGKFKPLMNENRTIHVAASVRENVTGEWIWSETEQGEYEQYWVCSVCGEHNFYQAKFCPNCGADMTGGNDG